MSILKELLPKFIERWATLESIDKDVPTALTLAAVAYYKHRGQESPLIKSQEQRWYESLAAGAPDFSIYNEPLSNLWACWRVYSRRYLKELIKKEVFSNIKVSSVVDLGCGCGYSTATLKELLPDAEVFGTELPDSQQWRFAEQLGKERGFSLVHNVQELNRHIDLVFASEYFEHFANPIAHLLSILEDCTPKFLIVANSFNTHAAGHFILSPLIGREFNRTLKRYGYNKMRFGIWNDKPACWYKESAK